MVTYLVAGGSRGIGRAIVGMLAQPGNRVEVWSRSADGLEPSDAVQHVACDFTDLAPLPEPSESVQGRCTAPER